MILVKAYFNTEADGTLVPEDLDLEDGPLCYYGPFPSLDEAISWMENDWPDDFTDTRDVVAGEFQLERDVWINPPSTITGDIPDEDIRDDSQELHAS